MSKLFGRKRLIALLANDCERGLLMLKDLMESGSMTSDTQILGLQNCDGFEYVGIRQNGGLDEMSTQMSKGFEELTAKVEAGLLPTPMYYFAFFHRYDLVARRCDYTCALAYDELPESQFGLASGKVDSHQTLKVLHTGAYKYLGNAWSTAILEKHRLKLNADKNIPKYERYLNNPLHFIPEDLQTEISIPLVNPL